VFLTVDRNLSFQQPLPQFKIAVVIMRARTNRLRDLLPIVPRLLDTLPDVKRDAATWIGSKVTGRTALHNPEL